MGYLYVDYEYVYSSRTDKDRTGCVDQWLRCVSNTSTFERARQGSKVGPDLQQVHSPTFSPIGRRIVPPWGTTDCLPPSSKVFSLSKSPKVLGGTVDISNSFNLYSLLYAKDLVASTSTDLDGSILRNDRSVHPRSSRLVSALVIRVISQARENLPLKRLWAVVT